MRRKISKTFCKFFLKTKQGLSRLLNLFDRDDPAPRVLCVEKEVIRDRQKKET